MRYPVGKEKGKSKKEKVKSIEIRDMRLDIRNQLASRSRETGSS